MHPARRYDYWLGGKNNFAVDRASGDAIAARFPTIRVSTVENRRFLGRAVRYLAGVAGIDQFLDIGTGLPAEGNTHEVAQQIAPDARVVYVDNDPIVLAHARALLTSSGPAGATAYLDADLRRPDAILAHPVVTSTLDLTRPVGLMLVAVLHFLTDEEHPHAAVRTLLDALAPGSFLVLTHAVRDYLPPERATDEVVTRVHHQSGVWMRSLDDIARFCAGLNLVPPGMVPTAEWHADHEPGPRPSAADVATACAVARVPGGVDTTATR